MAQRGGYREWTKKCEDFSEKKWGEMTIKEHDSGRHKMAINVGFKSFEIVYWHGEESIQKYSRDDLSSDA